MSTDFDSISKRAEQLYHDYQMDNLPKELKRNSIDYYYLSVYPSIGSLSTNREKPFEYPEEITNIYIHVPYCSGSCSFCSYVFNPVDAGKDLHLIKKYFDLLKRELLLHSENTNLAISYLYFGGGSPSLTPPGVLEDFMAFLNDNNFVIQGNIFATLELHPEIFSRADQIIELLDISRRYRINRFSVGFQSHESSLLKQYTRRHGSDFLDNAFDILKSEGAEYINIDTMYGLPNQSIESWYITLDRVLKICPDSISCYFLFVDRHTRLHNDVLSGSVCLPSHSHIQIQHLMSQILLESNDFIELPNDFYWKPRQQAKMTEFKPRLPSETHTLALGAGAYGYINGAQYCNYFDTNRYAQSIEKQSLPIWKSRRLDDDETYIRDIMFSLKNEPYLDAGLFHERYAKFVDESHPDVVQLLLDNDLIKSSGYELRLTGKGRLCVEEIATAFDELAAEPTDDCAESTQDRMLNEKHNYFPSYRIRQTSFL